MTKIDLKAFDRPKQDSKTNEFKKGKWDFLNKDIQLFGNSFNDKKKERFYSELCILFSAGVDIRAALELIEEEQEKEKDRLLFQNIKNMVIGGTSFSKAIESTGVFTAYEYFSIQIGEESGRLKEVLLELSTFFSKKIAQKRLLTSALSYPAIVFAVTLGAVIFMMKFMVPMFTNVFKQIKGELPYFTRLVIKASFFFTNYSVYLFIVITVLGVFFYYKRKTVWFRKLTANVLMRTPIINNMIHKIYLARFCTTMNLLISAKTPLVTAIDLLKKMIGFYPMEASLDIVKEDIMKGQPLSSSLSKFKIYNKRMTSLLKVAEEVNELDVMFGKLSQQYSDEVEHQTKVLGSLIEPIMIIILGLFVGIILIAMYLPLFQMSTSVG
ncbi:MAG TPA: type II secretion system F family protein [Bacteroidia bacterium]|jgi:type IV pilus assembly protein PilC